jgi:hypothetical protein
MIFTKVGRFLELLLTPRPDFRSFWEAGRLVILGRNPYEKLLSSLTPFNYPPPTLLFLPLISLVPFGLSAVFWNFFSFGSLILAVFLLVKMVKWKLSFWQWFLLYSLLFCSFPVKFTLGMGQINHFVLLFLVAGIDSLSKKRSQLSGILFALASCIKLSPFLWGIYLWFKKERKAVIWMVLTAASLFLISLLIFPWDFQKKYFTKIFLDAFPQAGKEVYYNQALSGFTGRQFYQFSKETKQIITYSLSVFLLFITIFRLQRISQLSQWSAVLALMVMINLFSWQHHLVFLIPCFFFLIEEWKKRKILGKRWLGLFFAYLFLAINFPDPGRVGKFWGAWVLSHGFYGATLLWALSLI